MLSYLGFGETHGTVASNTPSDLQLSLWQWGAGNVYLLSLSKAKR